MTKRKTKVNRNRTKCMTDSNMKKREEHRVQEEMIGYFFSRSFF